MNRISHMLLVLLLAVPAFAADGDDALSELDAKISKGLANEKWHPASKTFVRVLWEDYRKAHISRTEDRSTRSISGKRPEVEQYGEYLGAFGRGVDASRPVIEIVNDDAGRYYVKLEGHTIPSVTRNKTILFTTGDVVHANIVQLADKPYCTLEMYLVIRTGGKFFLAAPSAPPEKWMPLSKLKE